jgi:endonuclease/exonuclease/phosphatase family metal-dependent hydrolase
MTFARPVVRALTLLAVLVGAACAPARVATGAHPLRVVSYNIQYGGGGTELPAVAAAIRALDPDLVALQEVDVHWGARSGHEDQAAALASVLGMEVRFAPIYSIPDPSGARPERQFGLALLSRYPVTRFTNHDLTRLSTQTAGAEPSPQPGLLEATIDVHGTPLRVFNTHLDYRPDPAVRERQVAEMLALIGDDVGPLIVLGDLNAGPEAPELRPLLARLRDAWARGEGSGHTFPSAEPAKRIDFVLVSDAVEVRRARVPATTASDHRPVVVELLVPAQSPRGSTFVSGRKKR